MCNGLAICQDCHDKGIAQMRKELDISIQEEPDNADRLRRIFKTSLLNLGWDPKKVDLLQKELEQKAIAMQYKN